MHIIHGEIKSSRPTIQHYHYDLDYEYITTVGYRLWKSIIDQSFSLGTARPHTASVTGEVFICMVLWDYPSLYFSNVRTAS